MTNSLFKLTLLIVLVIWSTSAYSLHENFTGDWQTIDDETKQPKSIINLSLQDGKLIGQIVKLFRKPEQEQDPLCVKCKDKLHNRKIIGLEVLTEMVFDDDEWNDGQIFDPKNGKFYDCKIWLEDGKLKVRGYIGFFFRTQTWVRPDSPNS